MKLAVTGGRDVHVSDDDFAWLLSVYEEVGADTWILGGARGVDREVEERVRQLRRLPGSPAEFQIAVFSASWKRYGKLAGPIRNQEMIDEADALAVFPGGSGTADCAWRAERRGIPIYRRKP